MGKLLKSKLLNKSRSLISKYYFLFIFSSQKFQNRRTKWKKQENVTDGPDQKQNGSTKGSTNQEFTSDSPSPLSTKTGKSVAAELNAKITAKQNSRLKQQSNGTKVNKHMEPPKVKAPSISHKTSSNFNTMSHEMPVQFIDKNSMMKSSSFHNFHDVESRLSVSKIPINDFKAKSTTPVALNLKRNYLWKKLKFQKLKKKWGRRWRQSIFLKHFIISIAISNRI